MNRSLVCVHCGTTVMLETRARPLRTPLAAHLPALHDRLMAFDELPRWAALLEHFRVVPPRHPVIPSVVRA